MVIYPFQDPQVLTDELYIQYGGETGSTSAFLRSVAFTAAEEQISTYLHSFLNTTTVTGTYRVIPNQPITTDWAWVDSIDSINLKYFTFDTTCSVDTESACGYIASNSYGIILPNLFAENCNCSGHYRGLPDQVEIAYTSGIGSGTVYGKSFMMSLVSQAQLNLKEISYDLGGNESAGDIGVQQFSNQDYSETRVSLLKTALGSSAISNRTARLLRKYRRMVRMRL